MSFEGAIVAREFVEGAIHRRQALKCRSFILVKRCVGGRGGSAHLLDVAQNLAFGLQPFVFAGLKASLCQLVHLEAKQVERAQPFLLALAEFGPFALQFAPLAMKPPHFGKPPPLPRTALPALRPAR